jgi:hypothetical protein
MLRTYRVDLMKCEHEDCGYDERVWLPINDEPADIVRHPYCRHCGVVRNLSVDRAVGVGYFMNVLSSVKKLTRKEKLVTDTQIRLISKELMDMEDFEDKYWMNGSSQEDLFIKTVKKYCNLSESYIRSFL